MTSLIPSKLTSVLDLTLSRSMQVHASSTYTIVSGLAWITTSSSYEMLPTFITTSVPLNYKDANVTTCTSNHTGSANSYATTSTANTITIVFGPLAAFLALAGVVVACLQYRHSKHKAANAIIASERLLIMPSPQTSFRPSEDIEMGVTHQSPRDS
ncbi:hypothetical protein EJ03DRAFT_192655 [Teratosphaeria nubilosa]|uniref:Uncharacterized protein n=1 Tax=Teratosphaeria nubilosa TaxID=161662 RepID=A0A6G1L053_9PEZI|nr:hypothetical protein EJ03DRAFT_192655 [Teratosphaeria nubilosa]